jgi:hypothetical protein
MRLYGLFINLDERGEFFADVRDTKGNTVYEIHGFDIFEDGFMQHKHDVEGLTEYLQQLGVILKDSEVQLALP